MFTLKLCAIGNCVGLVLPKESLAKMNVGLNDTLFMTETPDGYILIPYDSTIEKQITLGREIMNEYRDTLRALAK